MNILVCSRYGLEDPEARLEGWWDLAALKGHRVDFSPDGNVSTQPDALVAMSVSQLDAARECSWRWPNSPIYCWQWDTYSWIWTDPRPDECYDWRAWGELLRKSRVVWVPSDCTAVQARLWWGPSLNCRTILAAVKLWEPSEVRDEGFAYCPLRKLPDRWYGKFSECCKAMGITYRHSDHDLSLEEYHHTVERCRFVVSHFWEASTGGLTLLEAHALGKPVLIHDSPWHGGKQYLWGRPGVQFFKAGDEGSFRRELHRLACNPPKLDQASCRGWIETHFSRTEMMGRMLEDLESAK